MSKLEINSDESNVTLINVLSVTEGNQEKLLKILKDGAENIMANQSGYLGSSILKSLDGKTVTVYAKWESGKHIGAVMGKPEMADYLESMKGIATASPGVYAVSHVHKI